MPILINSLISVRAVKKLICRSEPGRLSKDSESSQMDISPRLTSLSPSTNFVFLIIRAGCTQKTQKRKEEKQKNSTIKIPLKNIKISIFQIEKHSSNWPAIWMMRMYISMETTLGKPRFRKNCPST